MKRRILLSALLALVLGCAEREPGEGGPASDFMLYDLEGKRVYLNEYRGRIVVLNFWSLHCVPCRAEMPKLQALQERNQKGTIAVLGICADPEEPEYISGYAKALGITYRNALDKDSLTVRKFGVSALPATFIVDGRGTIRLKKIGYRPGEERTLEKAIDELLAREAGSKP